MRDRIGILGGSFNPIHLGHLNVADVAIKQLDLQKVLFVPCKVSPFKTEKTPELYVSDIHRLKMIEFSIAQDKKLSLSCVEIERGGISYSHDTVVSIKQNFPNSELFFLIGTDTLLTLSKWYKIQALLTMCEFVTVARPGMDRISRNVPGFTAEESRRLNKFRITGRLFDISSSDIRRRIAAGKPIEGLVAPKVEDYIRERKLYLKER